VNESSTSQSCDDASLSCSYFPGEVVAPRQLSSDVEAESGWAAIAEYSAAQVRFSGSGKQITEITVLVNQRRRNSDGERVEAEPTRHVVRAFKTLAENIAESLAKGDRVFVHGTVTTDVWTDKQTGEKRTAQRVLAEIVGPSLRWATARITKTTRTPATDEQVHDSGEHEA
jgi:single-strand DNA-binding protein